MSSIVTMPTHGLLESGVRSVDRQRVHDVLHVHDADDRIETRLGQREPGVHLVLGDSDVLFEGATERKKLDPALGDEDVRHALIGETERAIDDLGLALTDDPVLVRLLHDELQLLFAEWRLFQPMETEPPQDDVRECCERADEGLHASIEDA